MAKRDIFGELMEGVTAVKEHREGKITLRGYRIDAAPLPKVDSKMLRGTRKKLGWPIDRNPSRNPRI
jgi:putative transcriptional regulator